MNDPIELLKMLFRPAPLFELLVLWAGMYFVLRFLRGSSGLGLLRGLMLLSLAVYLVAQMLTAFTEVSLPHLEVLLKPSQGILILIIAVLVLFQPEIRRGFIRIGENPAFDFLTQSGGTRGLLIAEAAERLAHRKIGALIVVERSIGLRDFMEGAVSLSAEVSPPLLESIFQPGGPLHDGAVVIREDRIVAASCLLPLSESTRLSPEHGTRHRAAVGVSEKTDAIAVVVSEESGTLSYAYRGELIKVANSRRLARDIDELLLAPQATEAEA